MSSSVCAPLSIDLRSRRWELRVVALCLLACAQLPWTLGSLSFPVQWLLAAGGTASVCYGFIRAHWLPTGGRLIELIHTAANEWHLQAADQNVCTTSLHASCRVFRHVLWMRFTSGHALLLGPGDLPAEEFRRLRVALRTAGFKPHASFEGAT